VAFVSTIVGYLLLKIDFFFSSVAQCLPGKPSQKIIAVVQGAWYTFQAHITLSSPIIATD